MFWWLRNSFQSQWDNLTQLQQKEVIQVSLNLHRDCTQVELIPKLTEVFHNTFQLESFDPKNYMAFLLF